MLRGSKFVISPSWYIFFPLEWIFWNCQWELHFVRMWEREHSVLLCFFWLPQALIHLAIIPASGWVMLGNHLSSAAVIWETEANKRISRKMICALVEPHACPVPASLYPCPWAKISALRSCPIFSISTKISSATVLQDNEHFFKGIIQNTVALNASKLVQHSNWAKPAGNSAILWICCQF